MKDILDNMVIEVDEDMEEDRTEEEIRLYHNRAARFEAKARGEKIVKKDEEKVESPIKLPLKKAAPVKVEEEEEEEEFFEQDEEESEEESDEESEEESSKKKKGKKMKGA
jgi:hypothetical protein